MSDKFMLNGHDPVPCDDLIAWARWFEKADRIIAKTDVGPSRVSTVFLGLNQNYGDGPPLLFETMIFGGPLDQDQDRCSTWEQAEAMHEAACQKAREALS